MRAILNVVSHTGRSSGYGVSRLSYIKAVYLTFGGISKGDNAFYARDKINCSLLIKYLFLY